MATPHEDPQHPGEVVWTDARDESEPEPFPVGDDD